MSIAIFAKNWKFFNKKTLVPLVISLILITIGGMLFALNT